MLAGVIFGFLSWQAARHIYYIQPLYIMLILYVYIYKYIHVWRAARYVENPPANNYGTECRLLPGPQNRREGGQGIVVFATSNENSDLWAIKFFFCQGHFAAERAIYEDHALKHMLPEVRMIAKNRATISASFSAELSVRSPRKLIIFII